MLFIRVLNYFRGYLIITIAGSFPERFVNICIHRGIAVWDVKTVDGSVYAKIAAHDFCNIRGIACITKSRVRIAQRCGLPFVIRRYRRRWPALLGLVLCAAILGYTTTHVMSVDITGNSRIPEEKLRAELSAAGVAPGAAVRDMQADRIRNEMMIADGDIAWLGVNVKGSRVYIEITERLDSAALPHITDENCSLVAAKDGVIMRLEVKRGQTMVKKGDGVRAGDVLVSGIIDSVYGGFRAVHAYGEVYAQTEYKAVRSYSLVEEKREYTGEVKRLFSLDLFKTKAPLYTGSMRPEGWEERQREYVLRRSIFGHEVELGGVIHEFYKYNSSFSKIPVSEAVERGVKELTQEVEAQIPEGAEIISRTNDHNILTGDVVEVTVIFECSENIAEEVTIDKSLIDKSEEIDYDIEGD